MPVASDSVLPCCLYPALDPAQHATNPRAQLALDGIQLAECMGKSRPLCPTVPGPGNAKAGTTPNKRQFRNGQPQNMPGKNPRQVQNSTKLS